MKILVISNMFPTKATPAFGIFVKNQVDLLAKKGNTLHVAAIQNAKMGKVQVLKKYSTWMLSSLFRLLWGGRSYDIVHAHYAFPSGVIASWFKKRYGIPYVVTCHGGDLNKMARKGKFFRRQTEKILKDASHVIAVGHDLERQVISDFDVPEEDVSVLSMGVDPSVFYPRSKTDIKKKFHMSSGSTHLLFVGNIIEEKGIADLVEAVSIARRENPNIILHVVGQAKQEEYFYNLKQRSRELQLEENVYFHGPKPQKEVADWMSAADIFVLPSHIEGFGLVAAEAMACATPVIGTDTGGLTQLLSDEAGVIAKPKSPESLAEAIQLVINNEDLRKKLIHNGKVRAKQNDAEVITSSIVQIYNEAIQRQVKTNETKNT